MLSNECRTITSMSYFTVRPVTLIYVQCPTVHASTGGKMKYRHGTSSGKLSNYMPRTYMPSISSPRFSIIWHRLILFPSLQQKQENGRPRVITRRLFISGYLWPTFFSVSTLNSIETFFLQMSLCTLVIAVFLIGWFDNETKVFFSYILTLPPPTHAFFFFVPSKYPTRRRGRAIYFLWGVHWRGLYDEWRRDLPINDLVLERI